MPLYSNLNKRIKDTVNEGQKQLSLKRKRKQEDELLDYVEMASADLEASNKRAGQLSRFRNLTYEMPAKTWTYDDPRPHLSPNFVEHNWESDGLSFMPDWYTAMHDLNKGFRMTRAQRLELALKRGLTEEQFNAIPEDFTSLKRNKGLNQFVNELIEWEKSKQWAPPEPSIADKVATGYTKMGEIASRYVEEKLPGDSFGEKALSTGLKFGGQMAGYLGRQAVQTASLAAQHLGTEESKGTFISPFLDLSTALGEEGPEDALRKPDGSIDTDKIMTWLDEDFGGTYTRTNTWEQNLALALDLGSTYASLALPASLPLNALKAIPIVSKALPALASIRGGVGAYRIATSAMLNTAVDQPSSYVSTALYKGYDWDDIATMKALEDEDVKNAFYFTLAFDVLAAGLPVGAQALANTPLPRGKVGRFATEEAAYVGLAAGQSEVREMFGGDTELAADVAMFMALPIARRSKNVLLREMSKRGIMIPNWKTWGPDAAVRGEENVYTRIEEIESDLNDLDRMMNDGKVSREIYEEAKRTLIAEKQILFFRQAGKEIDAEGLNQMDEVAAGELPRPTAAELSPVDLAQGETILIRDTRSGNTVGRIPASPSRNLEENLNLVNEFKTQYGDANPDIVPYLDHEIISPNVETKYDPRSTTRGQGDMYDKIDDYDLDAEWLRNYYMRRAYEKVNEKRLQGGLGVIPDRGNPNRLEALIQAIEEINTDLATLEKVYARGDLTKEEYIQAKSNLLSAKELAVFQSNELRPDIFSDSDDADFLRDRVASGEESRATQPEIEPRDLEGNGTILIWDVATGNVVTKIPAVADDAENYAMIDAAYESILQEFPIYKDKTYLDSEIVTKENQADRSRFLSTPKKPSKYDEYFDRGEKKWLRAYYLQQVWERLNAKETQAGLGVAKPSKKKPSRLEAILEVIENTPPVLLSNIPVEYANKGIQTESLIDRMLLVYHAAKHPDSKKVIEDWFNTVTRGIMTKKNLETLSADFVGERIHPLIQKSEDATVFTILESEYSKVIKELIAGNVKKTPEGFELLEAAKPSKEVGALGVNEGILQSAPPNVVDTAVTAARRSKDKPRPVRHEAPVEVRQGVSNVDTNKEALDRISTEWEEARSDFAVALRKVHGKSLDDIPSARKPSERDVISQYGNMAPEEYAKLKPTVKKLYESATKSLLLAEEWSRLNSIVNPPLRSGTGIEPVAAKPKPLKIKPKAPSVAKVAEEPELRMVPDKPKQPTSAAKPPVKPPKGRPTKSAPEPPEEPVPTAAPITNVQELLDDVEIQFKKTLSPQETYEQYVKSVNKGEVGRLELEDGESIKSVSLRLHRAAQRLKTTVQVWDSNGVVFFRTNPPAPKRRPIKPTPIIGQTQPPPTRVRGMPGLNIYPSPAATGSATVQQGAYNNLLKRMPKPVRKIVKSGNLNAGQNTAQVSPSVARNMGIAQAINPNLLPPVKQEMDDFLSSARIQVRSKRYAARILDKVGVRFKDKSNPSKKHIGSVGRAIDPAVKFDSPEGRAVHATILSAANLRQKYEFLAHKSTMEQVKALRGILTDKPLITIPLKVANLTVTKKGLKSAGRLAVGDGVGAAGVATSVFADQLPVDEDMQDLIREMGVVVAAGGYISAAWRDNANKYTSGPWERITAKVPATTTKIVNGKKTMQVNNTARKGVHPSLQSGIGKLYDILQNPHEYNLTKDQWESIDKYRTIRKTMIETTNAFLLEAGAIDKLIPLNSQHGILQWFTPESLAKVFGDSPDLIDINIPWFATSAAPQKVRTLGGSFAEALEKHPDLELFKNPLDLFSAEQKFHADIRSHAQIIFGLQNIPSGSFRVPTAAQLKTASVKKEYQGLIDSGWKKIPGIDDKIFHPNVINHINDMFIDEGGTTQPWLLTLDRLNTSLRQSLFALDLSPITVQGAMSAIQAPGATIRNAHHLVGAMVFGGAYTDWWISRNQEIWNDAIRDGVILGREHGQLEKDVKSLADIPILGVVERHGFDAYLPIQRAITHKAVKDTESFIQKMGWASDLPVAADLTRAMGEVIQLAELLPIATAVGLAGAGVNIPGLDMDEDFEKALMIAMGGAATAGLYKMGVGSTLGQGARNTLAPDDFFKASTRAAKQTNRTSGVINKQQMGMTNAQSMAERLFLFRSPALSRNALILAKRALTDFGPEGAMARMYLVKTAAIVGSAMYAIQYWTTGELDSLDIDDPNSIFFKQSFMRGDLDVGGFSPSNPLLSLARAFMKFDPDYGEPVAGWDDWIPIVGFADWYSARTPDVAGMLLKNSVQSAGRSLNEWALNRGGDADTFHDEPTFPIPVSIQQIFNTGIADKPESLQMLSDVPYVGKQAEGVTDAVGRAIIDETEREKYTSQEEQIYGVALGVSGFNYTPETILQEKNRLRDQVIDTISGVRDRDGDGVVRYENDLNREQKRAVNESLADNKRYQELATIAEQEFAEQEIDNIDRYFTGLDTLSKELDDDVRTISNMDDTASKKRILLKDRISRYYNDVRVFKANMGELPAGLDGRDWTVNEYLDFLATDEDKAVENYFKVTEKFVNPIDGSIEDFEGLELAQQKYMDDLDYETAKYVSRNILPSGEQTEFEDQIDLAKEAIGYYYQIRDDTFEEMQSQSPMLQEFKNGNEFESFVRQMADQYGTNNDGVLKILALQDPTVVMYTNVYEMRQKLWRLNNPEEDQLIVEFYDLAPVAPENKIKRFQNRVDFVGETTGQGTTRPSGGLQLPQAGQFKDYTPQGQYPRR